MCYNISYILTRYTSAQACIDFVDNILLVEEKTLELDN